MRVRARVLECVWLVAPALCAEPAVDRTAWPGDELVDTAEARLRTSSLAGQVLLARENSSGLGREGYRIERTKDGFRISAEGSRGALYGAYALAENRIPQDGVSRPYFRYREWQSAAFQANFNLPLGGAFDRPLEEISEVVRRTIQEAPRYGINALQLMGRAGEGGIDVSWLVEYEKFPKLARRRIGWGIGRRIEEIRKLAAEAHRHGLDFLIWDHEIVFPEGMLEAYPEIRGVQYPVCFSHPFVLEFLRGKLEEFFTRLPEVDGLDLTFAETRGYNLLEHHGCQCDQCRRTSTAEKVRRVVLTVYEVCKQRNKRLEVRSYNQQPRDAEVMSKALRGLPDDILIIGKNTIVDFRGAEYPDNPMLGTFQRQPEALELTALPEGSGYGYIPALLGHFYKDKIGRLAVERRLQGMAIRTDYHLQYAHATAFTDGPPILTFDTLNDFNVFASSRLSWNPSTPVDSLWSEWVRERFGEAAAPVVERALRRTAAISQGIFFVKGFSLLTHLNMPAHLATIDAELDRSYLLEYFPENAAYRNTHERLKKPSEDTIAEVLAEKERAIGEAQRGRQEIETVRRQLHPERYTSLVNGFETSENAARLWKEIANVYFRLQRVRAGLGATDTEKEKLRTAVASLTSQACRIEKEQGRRWPVYPAARGVTAYEFAAEAMQEGGMSCDKCFSCP